MITYTLIIFLCTNSGCTQQPNPQAGMSQQNCVAAREVVLDETRAFVAKNQDMLAGATWRQARCEPSGQD